MHKFIELSKAQFHLASHIQTVIIMNLTLAVADFGEDVCFLAVTVEKVIVMIPCSLSALPESLFF